MMKQDIALRHTRRWLIAIFALTLCFESAWAARWPSYEEDRSAILRGLLDSVEDIRHEMKNHEAEIRTFEEKFKTQDDLIDSLRQQVADAIKSIQDTAKLQSSTLESKLANQKAHSSDVAEALTDYKRRINELEKAIELQNRNLENLQAAMRALTEVLQGKSSNPDKVAEGNIYRVKSGDNLEKIAKQNNTTVKKLKELNDLKSDQIIIGQKLKLPD